jgi:hypothetical protein
MLVVTVNMNLTLSEAASSALRETSTILGISPQQLAEQLLQDHLAAELNANETAFLVERAMQHYGTLDAAEAVVERLNERAISESLDGSSRFLVAEVLQDEDGYRNLRELAQSEWLERSDSWATLNS